MLGVAREHYLLVRIELACGVKQTQDARVYQIVQVHVHRQVFVYPHGNCLYQGQVFQYDAIALGYLAGQGADHSLGLHSTFHRFLPGRRTFGNGSRHLFVLIQVFACCRPIFR